MKKYQCIVCGWIYDEAEGWPQDGIVAGTKWDDIPDAAFQKPTLKWLKFNS
jgi:rubredoxin